MKRIYIKSHKENPIDFDNNEVDLISDLILFDLDRDLFYYLIYTPSDVRLNFTMTKLKDRKNSLTLKDSYLIKDYQFDELLDMPINSFYRLNKNEFLIKLGLEEHVI
jgi:hypothetical protein